MNKMGLTFEQECRALSLQELWTARKQHNEEMRIIEKVLEQKLKLNGEEYKTNIKED